MKKVKKIPQIIVIFIIAITVLPQLVGKQWLSSSITESGEKINASIWSALNNSTQEASEVVVEFDNNKPNFSSEDLSLENGYWQEFSELDQLNRVGVANAMLHKDFMPTAARESIKHIHPTGWKQKKMESGEMLYNRSHLIAFRFTGENDNWQNLLTGTEQFNQEYMTIYEEKVAEYLKETDNHVRYRVTPHFLENELVARSVQIEAQSIEDSAISFNVIIYNVQDNYEINYSDGSSKKVN
ncbi:DNA-entry nuclease [Enterococcus sp. PF1-24]|uniref:DNA/RNA non-specific endonuclease n=1 Tax=unclassified Enterococcus TaxID=2608891 RepID=UPI00247565F0|nr:MULTISPECIES: DNA/RNA non-specific endonuclease [unclassified Enterococcus]MDH6364530.1 DNA-entry nuclease [Enterococcus sp. PFB1-1]MDH6401593.1 DNA-entry nuclease [Enterococcus sp. PF1-24]